ncbi:ribosomal RNA-processing protein 14-C [Ananas comosus]|uniref:Ribosomal RNA-processing protein 14-C n=1 Tax=Ananas comosus TaxID=4615 RepID=A0A6P5G4D9_ANACO|nr:ribosomal RNA-processing protein 14-C [Ananas comosus]
MKRKKTMAASAAAAPIPPEPDLKALIGEHSLFFDRLVDLIPARFYVPLDDEDRPWYQGLSKAAKACVKIQSRENLKKARRARLDPAAPPSSTVELLSKSIAAAADSNPNPNPNPNPNQGEEEEEDEDEDEAAQAQRPAETMDDRTATDVELRRRLQARIVELRSTRNTRPETINKPKKEKKKKNKSKKKKKKNEEEGGPSSPLGKRKRDEEESNAAPTDISFGKVRSGGEDNQNKGKKKKSKLSKQQELERARRLEAAKKDPEKGEKFAMKHSWKAAASRAAGEKVHDDPKLLKESIKREERSRKKHAEKWKERMETVEKARAEKQKTRADNIRGRAEQKRMRRIEKREKKLMRPGFEGRKEGYING